MLGTLHAKRHLLIGQRDQINANLNATLGAIQVVDELIAEQTAAHEKAALDALAAQEAAEKLAAAREAPQMLPVITDDALVEAEDA